MEKQKARLVDSGHQLLQDRRLGKVSSRRKPLSTDLKRAREGVMLCRKEASRQKQGQVQGRPGRGTVQPCPDDSPPIGHRIRPLIPAGVITVPAPDHRGLQCMCVWGNFSLGVEKVTFLCGPEAAAAVSQSKGEAGLSEWSQHTLG